ncbi:hypothetical protein [Riemerella anatipestifer]|uniref:Uncharacterized protein n=2 Tax=Riemerella anatipestifer TaxID=34085 RepID=A0AAP3AP36_RIEAN|nr:hypothetical protein [Riemerella anatipestifer]MBT0550464.1 hypothetical protein [Riemerella anatipestifer]MBT0553425.1 hypothetical protein [Riemerella anatipestifer]MBT0573961.1 hypothetical protein [Riemerella anatipestifer]MCE3023427.1 hypothetical protein [Riemerella anatipestifer]MCO7319792.1 hypothetical protein [Riemerella anatipestifer]
MATYEGTIEDFKKFIDGYTRNLVQKLTRKVKKNRTCSSPKCKNRSRLQAAHIKGSERPVIIKSILDDMSCSLGDNYIKVDLNDFEKRFIEAHTPYDKVIKILCFDCHRKYDNNEFQEIVPLIDEEIEIDADVITEEDILKPFEEIKPGKLAQKIFSNKINTISDEVLLKLLDETYCKLCFGIGYSVLKEFRTEKDIYDDKGKQRYYSPENLLLERIGKQDEISKKFILSNHWFKNQIPFLTKWNTEN